MELKWLSAFVTLSEYLNFNKAAASMYITQPALSKYIAALESELGVRLFERSKRSVSLTPEGLSFLPHAMNILNMTDEAVAAVRSPSSPALQGPLRIGVDQYLDYRDCITCGLPAVLNRFRRQYPMAQIELSCLPFREIDAQLRSNILDIGFSIVYTGKLSHIQASGFRCLPLLQDQMSIVVPPSVREAYDSGAPIHTALEKLKLLIMDEDTEYIVEKLSSLAAVGITPMRTTCASWNEILFRANLGEGFFLLSGRTALASAAPLQTISLEELGYEEKVYHVALWKSQPTPLTERFLAILSD